jgi:hypothetical protein
MFRNALLRVALIGFMLFPSSAVAQITPAQAAPFVGEWKLTLQGDLGPGTFDVSIKVQNQKVLGQISGENQALQPITEISTTEKNLVLSYSFSYEGMTVDAVVTLMPQADGKTSAQIAFASGAYVMTGTATKHESKQ